MYDWATSGGYQWDTSTNGWLKTESYPGYYFVANEDPLYRDSTREGTCAKRGGTYWFDYGGWQGAIRHWCTIPGSSTWPVSFSPNPYSETLPATPQQFEDDLAPLPFPNDLPNHFPEPLPVQLPVINPTPGVDPLPQPLRVPLGDPQPVPNSNPQQWRQPVLDIVPAPSPQRPLQVDLVPRDVITESPTAPNPIRDPYTPESPQEDPNSDSSDFCTRNPTVLACQEPELDTPDGEVPRRTESLEYEAVNAWGNGSCPADSTMTLKGRTLVVYEWGSKCQLITTYVKPLILTVSLVIALFILMPGGRPE